MAVLQGIWVVFIFVFGCCVGSFLNVVVYRLPRDKSITMPPSACPACGKNIHFYDNIPLVSWLILGGKCRYCKAPISPRYFVIEFLTGLVFIGLFILYFQVGLRRGLETFLNGGWFVYLLHIILLSALIAASAIDLERWVIPLSICWFVTAAGLIGSALGVYVIDLAKIGGYLLLPSASASVSSLAAGAAIGLAISLCLLATGLIKRSYEMDSAMPDGTDDASADQNEPRATSAPSESRGTRITNQSPTGDLQRDHLFAADYHLLSGGLRGYQRNPFRAELVVKFFTSACHRRIFRQPVGLFCRLRCRLGHTHLRHSRLWKRGDGPRRRPPYGCRWRGYRTHFRGRGLFCRTVLRTGLGGVPDAFQKNSTNSL